MVILKANEGKKMKFSVSVSGVETRDLVGAFRMIADGIEYGIKTTVENDKLVANIPPLTDIMGNLKEGQNFEARLDVIAGDTYIVPWTDSVRIEIPVKVEAALAEEETIQVETKPIIRVDKIDEEETKKTDEMCGADHKSSDDGDKKKKKKKKSKFAEMIGG